MILPVYKSLSNGKFAFSDPDYSLAENFNIADIFIKLFPTEYDTVRMEGMPILYAGTLALVCTILYFTWPPLLRPGAYRLGGVHRRDGAVHVHSPGGYDVARRSDA